MPHAWISRMIFVALPVVVVAESGLSIAQESANPTSSGFGIATTLMNLGTMYPTMQAMYCSDPVQRSQLAAQLMAADFNKDLFYTLPADQLIDCVCNLGDLDNPKIAALLAAIPSASTGDGRALVQPFKDALPVLLGPNIGCTSKCKTAMVAWSRVTMTGLAPGVPVIANAAEAMVECGCSIDFERVYRIVDPYLAAYLASGARRLLLSSLGQDDPALPPATQTARADRADPKAILSIHDDGVLGVLIPQVVALTLLQPGGICPVASPVASPVPCSSGGGGVGFLTVCMMLVAVAASGAAYYFFKLSAKATPKISATVTPSDTTGYDMRANLAAQHMPAPIQVSLVSNSA